MNKETEVCPEGKDLVMSLKKKLLNRVLVQL